MNLLKRLGIALTLVGMMIAMTLLIAPAQAASKEAADGDVVQGPVVQDADLFYRYPGEDGLVSPQSGGNPFPTFAEVPLPPTPVGTNWQWKYHGSRWRNGKLEDKVSHDGLVYWIKACGCDLMSIPQCPPQYC